MILYYAIGGGLGHLTRARAVIHTLSLAAGGAEVKVMTASGAARDRRVIEPATPIEVRPELAGDRATYNRWLRATIERLAPEAIYIDAFPAGIVGELCAFPPCESIPCFHVARLLRWERYRTVLTGRMARFERVYMAEPLDAAQQHFLEEQSKELVPIALCDPPSTLDRAIEERIRSIASAGAPLWCVVHSGPADEVMELLAYAESMAMEEGIEPQILLVTASPPVGLSSRVITIDLYPADMIYPYAARIITGCGFNAMRQTERYRDKHRFIPFARHYDNQEIRAARRVESIRCTPLHAPRNTDGDAA